MTSKPPRKDERGRGLERAARKEARAIGRHGRSELETRRTRRFRITAALTPGLNATSDDTELSNALLFQLGWVLRVYQDNFREADGVALALLRGFLTVPIQFSTLVWVFANATASPSDIGHFALPPDFETTASAARVAGCG